jgi:cellulose synthase/poly-beta-1,6-N-acetylglucosamine synthase-like glycosyltransferase
MSLFEIIFFITFFMLLACFSSYLVLMLYFSRKPRRIDRKRIFPTVSIIIATFNEEKVIAKKLANVATLDYPQEKLEVVIVDSGSTDGTRRIVNEFIQNSPGELHVRLLEQRERLGKAMALNYAQKHCIGDIVILSDADVLLDNDAVLRITSNFNDPRVGAVSGIEAIRNPDQSQSTKMEQGYRSFYNTLRMGETNLDSVVMCESEFAAYRRALVEEIPANSICDDMELTLRVRRKGFLTIYDDTVVFYENSPTAQKSRLKHKIRRGQGNQQALLRFANMLFRRKYGTFSFVILPFEFLLNVITPVLVPICIISFVLAVILSFNWPIILLPAAILALMAIMIYISLRFISPTTSITLVRSSTRSSTLGGSRMLLSIFDFIEMQLILFVSLILLVFVGPNYKWEKIEEVRES